MTTFKSTTTLISGSDNFYAGVGRIAIKDIAGAQTINVARGATVTLSKALGANVFNLQGASSDYQIKASGTKVTLTDLGGTSLVFSLGSDAQTLCFTNGSLLLGKEGKVLKLGDQSLAKSSAAVSAQPDAAHTSAGLFGSAATVFYASTSVVQDIAGDDIYNIGLGASFKLNGLNGNNVFNLEGTHNDYQIKASGKVVTLADKEGGVISFALGKLAQKLVFADGSAELGVAGKSLALGGQTLAKLAANVTAALAATENSSSAFPSSSTPLPPPVAGATVVEVNGASASPYPANNGDITFNIHPTTSYAYVINGFSVGDKVIFDAGSALSVKNLSGTDGVIEIVGSLANQSVVVTLTGVSHSYDGAVFGFNSFNNTFGAGSLV